MKIMHYAGLDVHKKMIAYCVKTPRGRLVEEGQVPATREALGEWIERFRKPLGVAMEATLFTGWIFDFFCERAAEVKVAHPQMLKAIACSKKKNDRLDACDIPDDMDGRSLLDLVERRSTDWPEDIFSEIHNSDILSRAVRTRRWKYSVRATSPFKENQGHPKEYEEDSLYDLKADPWELNNLIGRESHRGVVDVMKERLLQRLAGVGEKQIDILNAAPKPACQKILKEEEIYQ